MRLQSILKSGTTSGPCTALSPAEPIIKWAGGKRSLRGQLLPLAPPAYARYFEPFLGGATLYLSLAPPSAVLNDANGELIDLYEAVRDDPERVMAELDAVQPLALDEAAYYRIRAQDPASLPPAVRAARFIYLNKTCYNGLYRVNRAGRFNVPFGRYSKPPGLYNRANLLAVARLLKGAEMRQIDFREAVADARAGDFVYFDPPYVPLTTTASFTRYTRGAFDLADQRRLAETVHELTARGCKVLLSNSDTPIVRELYRDFTLIEVLAPRNINSDANGRQKIKELAVLNYAERRGERE